MAAKYRECRIGGCLEANLEKRDDGAMVLRSIEPLEPYPARLTDRFEHWAKVTPDVTLAARRDNGGEWRHLSYAQMLQRARSVGQALLDRGLSRDRPVVILSDNDLEHLTLALGALWVGIPHASISPAYSVIAQDFGKLRHILGKLQPGLVFASHAAPYARAIQECVGDDIEAVLTNGHIDHRASTPFNALLNVEPGPACDAAHARVGPDTIAKFMFTSGSTLQPKGVVITQRMWSANQQMLRQSMAFMADAPPVLVDWLPWNHVFGGNHNIGIVLYNGGTLYIDDGKPTPKGMAETLRNLREISPTVYFNVPKGFEELTVALEGDAALRKRLFSKLQAFMCGGAGLSQAAWARLDAVCEQAIGERIRIIGGLGMTETSPSCTFVLSSGENAGHIGLPCPGVDVKLAPVDGKIEIRFRGPNVMPGYWKEPELSAQAFDEEGYYRTGDAVKPLDPHDPCRGLLFDGRIAEDFKLSSGTFVNVGPLKARIVTLGAPLVQDAVITGLNRNDVGVLLFPRIDQCRKLAGLDESVSAAAVLSHPAVTAAWQSLIDALWAQGTGSASRVARLHAMTEPPSIDRGEITDKGSINQRNVLTHRAALVDALHENRIERLVLPAQGNLP